MAEPRDIALHMLRMLRKSGELLQADAVAAIGERFGEEYLYINENGNPAISPEVLAEFRGLTEQGVVWDADRFLWRWRQKGDPRGLRRVR